MMPRWLREVLANPPRAGEGVNPWLFTVGRQLHAHMNHAQMYNVLRRAVAHCGRHITEEEIRRAIRNSEESAWKRDPRSKADAVRGRGATRSKRDSEPVGTVDTLRWPAICPRERDAMMARGAAAGVRTLHDLWLRSLTVDGGMSCDDWMDWLFPGAEWLCLATDHPATARSRPPHKWSFGPADACGLVVPSPMTGPSGLNQEGKRSHRCLGNMGPRRWLVIEFDSGTLDEQAALHWHLRNQAAAMPGWPQLALVVASGGKSLHGWYGLCGSEEVSKALMNWARVLGADTATWNRCQLVRLPEGLRRKETAEHHLPDGWEPVPGEVRQPVWYWDPAAAVDRSTLCNTLGKAKSTSRGWPPESPSPAMTAC
jgi:hypothetical protein